jgi:hypothetical protein
VNPAFTDQEFLEWASNKPAQETYDGINNYTCPIAQFLNETGRAKVAYVGSEQWYDETLLTKKGKPSALYTLSVNARRAAVAIHPVNTFNHVVVRLSLLLEKRDMNEYYFEMRV